MIINDIPITPRHGGITRMKIFLHRFRPQDTDIVGQITISPKNPGVIAAIGGCIKMRHLRARVHPSIGAPRASDKNRMVGNSR